MPRKKKSSQHRDAKVVVTIGMNGTGKSYMNRKFLNMVGGRAVVVTYAGMPKIWRDVPIIDAADPKAWQWKSGLRQVIAANYEHPTKTTYNYVFEYIYRNFKSGSVLFDDCKEYITDKISNHPYLKRILSSFRHMELDLYFVVHSPSDVPRKVWTYTSTTFVGHTDELINPGQLRLSSSYEILKAQQQVKPVFLQRKQLNNGSHYGLFIKINNG